MSTISLEALPPEDAIAWFKRRGLIVTPTFDWRDGWAAAEKNSFAIAGITELDLLDDIHAEILRALEAGLPFEVFQENAEKIIRYHGWWGEHVTEDPITGKTRTVNVGNANRLAGIFETNINQAMNRGRYEQISDVAAARKATGGGQTYLQFNNSGGRICPTCIDYDGETAPINDARWQWMTPLIHNGCKCFLTSLSERDLKDFDYQISEPRELDIRTYENERTGHTVQALAGVQPGMGRRDWNEQVQKSFESYLKEQSPQNQKAIRDRLTTSE